MDKHTEEMMKRARESFDKMMEESTPAQRQDAAFKAMYGAAMLNEPTMVKADRKHLDQLGGPVFSDLQSMRVAEPEDEITRLRAELEASKGEAEALRVDAERYRFLRMNLIPRHVFMATGFTPPYEGTPDWIDKSVDAAIDAARGKDNG